MSQLFLSHSGRNSGEAIALLEWLKNEGWDDVFLDLDPKRGISAGERWERALNQAVNRCEAVLFLVSRDWLNSGWCLREFNLAHKLAKRIFGIVIEDIPLNELPINLTSTWQLVNLASGRDHRMLSVTLPLSHEEATVTFSAEGLVRLRVGLRRAGLDPTVFAWPPPSDPRRAPYPGLRPLDVEDAGIFFGREAQIIECLDRLRALRDAAAPRFLCILGSSGSGKSSFLRAGLLPRLSRDDRNFLTLPVLRPERAAINGKSGLLSILTAACEASNLGCSRADIRDAVAGGALTIQPLLVRIVEATAARLPDEPETNIPSRPPLVILPIDQGEELFLSEGYSEALDLLKILSDIVRNERPPICIIMTIRSEAFGLLQSEHTLKDINLQTLSFGPMLRGVYGNIIEGPLSRMREADRALTIEPALTAALLNDLEIGGGRDSLPLLAFTLERLWLDFGSSGRLTLADYDRLGRVRGSIEAGVEIALHKADADPRIPRSRAARLALLRRGVIPWLAGIDPETSSPRRRVAHRSEIPPEALPMIDLLVEARLLSTDIDPESGKATIEPAHEALLRQWGLLEGWLEEDFAILAGLEGVRRATQEWVSNDKKAAWLAHVGDRLAEAERLLARPDIAARLEQDEQAYLIACQIRASQDQAKDRRQRRMKRVIQVVTISAALSFALLSILLLIMTVSAFYQTSVANQNRSAALSALSSISLPTDQVRATKLALASWPRSSNDYSPKLKTSLAAIEAAVLNSQEIKIFTSTTKFVALSPDGMRILTQNSEHNGEVWDSKSGNLLTILRGHSSSFDTALFSPDGSRVLTTSSDKTARVWDISSGNAVATLEWEDNDSAKTLFSPNGKQVIIAQTAHSRKTKSQTWREDTGKVHPFLDGVERRIIESITFSPDGSRILVLRYLGKLHKGIQKAEVWDAQSNNILFSLEVSKTSFYSAVFSPNGDLILTSSSDATARIWDAMTGQERYALKGHKDSLNRAVFSDDGTRILTIPNRSDWLEDTEKTLRVWSADTGKMITEIEGHGDFTPIAKFSPDHTKLLTISYDNIKNEYEKLVRIWNTNNGQMISSLEGHTGQVITADFSSDSAKVITASADHTARVWDASNGKSIKVLAGHSKKLSKAKFLPQETHIATSSLDGSARVWDLMGVRSSIISTSGVSNALNTRYSSDGSHILVALSNNNVEVRKADSNDLVSMLVGHDRPVSRMMFSPNGNRILTASNDIRNKGDVRIWEKSTGRLLSIIIDPSGPLLEASFSPDGTHIIAALDNKTAQIWDALTGKVVTVFRGHESGVYSAVYSLDGTRVITASVDRTARLWDASTGQTLTVFKGHTGPVTSAMFSPDGSRVLTASEETLGRSDDGTARVWDANSGSSLVTIEGLGRLNDAVFSPDGKKVLTLSGNTALQIWDASNGNLLSLIIDSGWLSHVGFSHDGTRIIALSDTKGRSSANTAVVFDTETGGKIYAIQGLKRFENLSISPDNKTLLANSEENAITSLDLSLKSKGNMFQVACGLLPNSDLSDISEQYELESLEPICVDNPPLPDSPELPNQPITGEPETKFIIESVDVAE